MAKLNKSAGVRTVTLYELERAPGQGLITLVRKHAGERLVTEVQNADELSVVADTTSFYCGKMLHPATAASR